MWVYNTENESNTLISENALFDKDVLYYHNNFLYYIDKQPTGAVDSQGNDVYETMIAKYDFVEGNHKEWIGLPNDDLSICTINNQFVLGYNEEELKYYVYEYDNCFEWTKVLIPEELGTPSQFFVNPEMSERIILSFYVNGVEKFYVIKENGELKHIGQTEILPENVQRYKNLVFTVEGAKDKTIKLYDIK